MGNERYTPFDHLDAKTLWDQGIEERSHRSIVFPNDTTWHADKWLHSCETVIGQWFLQKWFNTQEFVDANKEIKELCKTAGLDPSCIHCSSRATIHDCKVCCNKGEKSNVTDRISS